MSTRGRKIGIICMFILIAAGIYLSMQRTLNQSIQPDEQRQIFYYAAGLFLALMTLWAALLSGNIIKRIIFFLILVACAVMLVIFCIDTPEQRHMDSGLYFFWNIVACFILIAYFSSGTVWQRRLARWAVAGMVLTTLVTTIWQLLLPAMAAASSSGMVSNLDKVIILSLITRAIAISIFLLVGAFIFWRTPQEQVAQLFLMFNIAFISLLRIGDLPPGARNTVKQTIIRFLDFPFYALSVGSIACLTCLFFHFFLIFPDRKPILDKYPILSYLLYLPGLWFIIDFNFQIYRNETFALTRFSLAFFCVYILLGIFSVAHSYFSAQQRRVRKQVKFVFLSIIASFAIVIGGGLWAVRNIGGDWSFGTFYATLGLIPIAFGYAIVKHRAMSVNLIIRRSLIYTVVSIIAGSLWIAIYYGLFQYAFSVKENRGIIALALALGVGFVMPRLEGSVQTFIDRTFYKEKYDYQLAISEFASALTSIIELDTLVELSVARVCETMHVLTGCLLLVEENANVLKAISYFDERNSSEPRKIVDSRGIAEMEWLTFASKGTFAGVLLNKGGPMTIEEIERHYKNGALIDDEMQKIIRFDAELCVPIISKELLIGVMLLGSKRSEDAYSREDAFLLSTLASQAAITIENTKLYAAKVERDLIKQELENARKIQQAILPESAPEVDGLDIASYFQPAMEVGGDYYDYVIMSPKQLGLAVGDVSGHGLDAGLMVSMAKSCLYTTTKTVSAVEDIMDMMNDMVCEVRERLLMTFSFSVINVEQNNLVIANAGHPFPYHLSNGELKSIEAGAYPLGVKRDAKYPSQSVDVSPGDILIYYSDGIVEAVNPQNELLGFERFEHILQNLGSHARDNHSAEQIRDLIMDNVHNFCGDVPFEDDVTLIVVRCTGKKAEGILRN